MLSHGRAAVCGWKRSLRARRNVENLNPQPRRGIGHGRQPQAELPPKP